MTLYKSLNAGLLSARDNSAWKVGKWRKVKPPTRECVGLNCSPTPLDAMRYVPCEIIAVVEVSGVIIKDKNKWTCEKMMIKRAYTDRILFPR